MKNKINKLSKGDFHTVQPEVILKETNLVLTIGEGELYKGSFQIENKLEGNIRGLVYPSSFRVRCREQGFEGEKVTVEFTYDGRNLPPGHVEHGQFTIVCNGGEYELPFTAIIEKPFLMSSYGKIQTLVDFKKLAMRDFQEAQRIFRSMDFYEILKYEEKRIYDLYDNLRKWSLGEQALEEFLVGVKHKERLFLCLSDDEKVYHSLKNDMKDGVTLTKNTWGFMPIKATVKGDFLSLVKDELTTDDFVGNLYRLEYYVHHKKLHAGRNFAQIHITTPYETVVFQVEATCKSTRNETARECDFLVAQIEKSYLGCLAGRVEWNVWMDSSLDKVKVLRDKQPDTEWYPLLEAHLYLLAKREDEARWILEHYNYKRYDMSRQVETGAYYLYLTALLKQEGAHVTRVVEELGQMYLRHPQSWQILCMLLDIDPQYKNYSERLRVLERQFFNGSNNVLVYAKAYECYKDKDSRLKKLGAFEIQVLRFAAKYKMLTKELALYMANLASQQKTFNSNLYKVLEYAYQAFEDPMILTSICTLLIKGNKNHNRYFKWYQKAVDAGLKIAQLYEYYMMSVEAEKVRGPLPRSIYLYFMYGNSLDYKKAALLYANILTYEDETGEVFDVYREQMERFAWEQLLKRHINDNLRIIYKRFCTEAEMNAERLEAINDICHAYEIKTKIRGMKYVLVIEKTGKIEQRVPYFDEGCQVYLYNKESRIVWESKEGRYYVDSISYDTKRLFYETRYVEMYKRFAEVKESEKRALEKPELHYESLKTDGIENYDETDVFRFCSKKIREENYEEDDFLTYMCYELYKKEQYDKVILTYLANYFCGCTREMKKVWKSAKLYGVDTHKLSEKIITQMLFSEDVFQEEEIFIDYYNGGPYFRLKQAYLAYISKEYIVKNRMVHKTIFEIILREQQAEEYLADICKAALLKYYAGKSFDEKAGSLLRGNLMEMCEKQLVFSFYMLYPEAWLRETLLYDKTLVSYRAKSKESKVKVIYELKKEGQDEVEYYTEPLLPIFENIYVKRFVLYEDELVSYYFKEVLEDEIVTSERKGIQLDNQVKAAGKYGRLNDMSVMSGDGLKIARAAYEYEENLANQIFVMY